MANPPKTNENPSELAKYRPEAEDAAELLPPVRSPRAALARTRADQAFSMRLAGASYRKIADSLGISQQAVQEAVKKRLRAMGAHMATQSGPDLLLQEIARLDELYEVAHARALGGPILDDEGEPVVDRDGKPRFYEPDPRWTLRAQEILKTRAELLGMTKTKIEITGANGGPVEGRSVSVDLTHMTAQQIAVLELMFRRMGVPVPTLTTSTNVPGSSVVSALPPASSLVPARNETLEGEIVDPDVLEDAGDDAGGSEGDE